MENAVYINNLHAVLPNSPVSNKEMEVVLGEVGGQRSRAKPVILRSNQIKTRYYAIDPETGEYNYTNASLAADAVRGLFNKLGTQLEQLDCLVASTSMADQIMPNHGVMVHGELKNPSLEVISTAGICLCGITALKYAYLNVKAGESQHSAVVASELASNVMHSRNFNAESEHKVAMLNQKPEIAFEKDFLRWMLSDGAGAALLSNKANDHGLSLRIDWIDVTSYADQLEACMYAGAEKVNGKLKSWTRFDSQEREQHSILSVKQDVKLLNENIVKYTVEDALSKIVQKRGIKACDYDFFLPHYSSGYFRERLFDGLCNIDFQIPYDKWFTNLTQKGNTGSASIFIMLDELFKSGQLTDGQTLLCYVPESGRFSSAFMQLTVINK
ncbi:beta-ketoacyl-ACP synthase III [Pseudoalteromonas sp. 2CM28B]|uniref:beta-ketoacyl-ACP synthase III n=1 Tax=Pseudoalteromonas sp. 2CM28B TaxID=2929851 RepID=UPI0020BFC098|nr:beta-ketoacyl-ACP synthase III [Pseudoalteromonas sp. 2CM28B]MCK8133426.1 beta-ketoacyl-ACP synthase III [Pseudoalteromonas sp. 2CM28B]